MRFLIDAQLPSKLCDILQELDIEAIHVNKFQKETNLRIM